VRVLERKDIIELLRADIEKAGSQSAWARKSRIDRTFINNVLQGRRQPSRRMLRALGLRAVVVSGTHMPSSRSTVAPGRMRRVRILERKDIVEVLRIQIEKAGSQAAWARKTGINRTYTVSVLHGYRQPPPSMIRALGLRTVAVSDD
jgi:hypothetical protein